MLIQRISKLATELNRAKSLLNHRTALQQGCPYTLQAALAGATPVEPMGPWGCPLHTPLYCLPGHHPCPSPPPCHCIAPQAPQIPGSPKTLALQCMLCCTRGSWMEWEPGLTLSRGQQSCSSEEDKPSLFLPHLPLEASIIHKEKKILSWSQVVTSKSPETWDC